MSLHPLDPEVVLRLIQPQTEKAKPVEVDLEVCPSCSRRSLGPDGVALLEGRRARYCPFCTESRPGGA